MHTEVLMENFSAGTLFAYTYNKYGIFTFIKTNNPKTRNNYIFLVTCGDKNRNIFA